MVINERMFSTSVEAVCCKEDWEGGLLLDLNLNFDRGMKCQEMSGWAGAGRVDSG